MAEREKKKKPEEEKKQRGRFEFFSPRRKSLGARFLPVLVVVFQRSLRVESHCLAVASKKAEEKERGEEEEEEQDYFFFIFFSKAKQKRQVESKQIAKTALRERARLKSINY